MKFVFRFLLVLALPLFLVLDVILLCTIVGPIFVIESGDGRGTYPVTLAVVREILA